MKITKPQLYQFFMHFCHDMGKVAYIPESDIKSVKKWLGDDWVAPCELGTYRTVGAWTLDYAGCYGGWVIEQIDSKFGAIDHPFGHKRHNISQMYAMICFSRESLRLKKNENN